MIIDRFRTWFVSLSDTKKEFVRGVVAVLVAAFIALFLGMGLGVLEAHAATYTPYASVTESTGQISTLISALGNQVSFDSRKPWFALRVGEYDYRLIYNLDADGSAMQLRYYAVSSGGYNVQWHLTRASVSDVSLQQNDYTIVGNGADMLSSERVSTRSSHSSILVCCLILAIIIPFWVFRVRTRRSSGGVTL